MNKVDCIIKDWELVTFKTEKIFIKVIRGIIIEDYNRPFEPGFWVCSTPIIYEDIEQNIVQTNNTVYKLVGAGESHETDEASIYLHMRNGLDFWQAKWVVENGGYPAA
ncbi:MAG: hypothetical protein CMP47_10145 [Rickettsiales bacterium]|nr:hypothetical protein [Rickettsiales bacterium]